jgi:hypothetical protein
MSAIQKWHEPQNMTEAKQFAEMFSKSELCPQDYKGKPEKALSAMVAGAATGLSPYASLQNIAVIRGKATIWGDA